ncbi:hypothetical protein F511_03896 [Dorcoceras hygrometricum]|uniref:Splicing factor 3B subunit 1-like n=1 Tax=Dorcoceras hygrometricum TaxID=472368 RepID=A0A2Z7DJK2_9LAMI|nr:hypothetical protein F511_03896 [Dorcoceras hygrometricum]
MEELAVDKVVKTAAKRTPAPAAEPVSKKKRTTVGRAAPTVKDLSIIPIQEAIPISMVFAGSPTVQRSQAPKTKLILREDSDEEETDEKEKDGEETNEKEKDEEEKDKAATDAEDTEPLRKVLKLTDTTLPNEESLPIDEILKQIPEDMFLPSISAEEPTPIKFGCGISFREVYWYKATLPKIDPADKGKEPLVEEIKGNTAKEIFALIYADVDFLVQIRDAQLRQHKLKCTRPSSSTLFGGATVQSGGIHSQFYPTIVSTSWIRSLIFIDGSWIIVQGADPNPARIALPNFSKSKKQLPQRPFVDDLAPICVFIEIVQDTDSQIMAYINRGRDDKKREDSSSGPQPDRSRPGGGSSSETSKKGGGSYKFRSLQQRKLILFVERDFRSDEDMDKESKREVFVKEKDLEACIDETT